MTSPVGDIGRYSREGRDLDEEVWKVSLYVWNPDATPTPDWERMTQPLIDATNSELYLKVDDLEQYILDQRLQFLYSGTLEDSGDTYVGYEDKNGIYYIAKYDSSGDPEYATGTGGIPDKSTPSNWTGLSYGSVASTF